MKNFSPAKKQKGFTLTELLIVVVILGILGIIVMRALSGNTDNAQAVAFRATASELAKGMGYIHSNLGTGLAQTNNPFASNMLDVLVKGREGVKDTFKTHYDRLGMRPLSSDIRQEGAGYYIFNSMITLKDCTGSSANRRVCSVFTNVSTPVAEAIAAKEGLTLEQARGKKELEDTLHISNATNGFHVVTFALVP